MSLLLIVKQQFNFKGAILYVPRGVNMLIRYCPSMSDIVLRWSQDVYLGTPCVRAYYVKINVRKEDIAGTQYKKYT